MWSMFGRAPRLPLEVVDLLGDARNEKQGRMRHIYRQLLKNCSPRSAAKAQCCKCKKRASLYSGSSRCLSLAPFELSITATVARRTDQAPPRQTGAIREISPWLVWNADGMGGLKPSARCHRQHISRIRV